MRNAFAAELVEQARSDERIVLLSGDIGNRLFNEYKSLFPERFYNCGVAEANMTGVAAGLAMSGLKPIAYTIAPFLTTRCMEQIKIDLCYHRLPVVIVGVGAGLSYAGLGATHHACEEIAMLRALPEMTIVCPGDALELRQALPAALAHDGPVYLRIGKKGEPVVHKTPPPFEIGRSITVRPGTDISLLSTGTMLPTATTAAEALVAEGISARVESVHTVKPLDVFMLKELFARYRLIVTIEEHSRIGGLGGAVAEWLADESATHGTLLRMGTEDSFLHKAGDQEYARRHHGLDVESLLKAIREHPAL